MATGSHASHFRVCRGKGPSLLSWRRSAGSIREQEFGLRRDPVAPRFVSLLCHCFSAAMVSAGPAARGGSGARPERAPALAEVGLWVLPSCPEVGDSPSVDGMLCPLRPRGALRRPLTSALGLLSEADTQKCDIFVTQLTTCRRSKGVFLSPLALLGVPSAFLSPRMLLRPPLKDRSKVEFHSGLRTGSCRKNLCSDCALCEPRTCVAPTVNCAFLASSLEPTSRHLTKDDSSVE